MTLKYTASLMIDADLTPHKMSEREIGAEDTFLTRQNMYNMEYKLAKNRKRFDYRNNTFYRWVRVRLLF